MNVTYIGIVWVCEVIGPFVVLRSWGRTLAGNPFLKSTIIVGRIDGN